jgi:hypothetical protein
MRQYEIRVDTESDVPRAANVSIITNTNQMNCVVVLFSCVFSKVVCPVCARMEVFLFFVTEVPYLPECKTKTFCLSIICKTGSFFIIAHMWNMEKNQGCWDVMLVAG